MGGAPSLDQPELTATARAALEPIVELLASEREAPSSVRDPARAWSVHVADSLSGLAFDELAGADAIADVGAGAGFPGLVLAAMLPQARVDLIESNARKCDFIERAAAAGGLSNARAIRARAEEWAEPDADGREAYDAVTARAVGRMSTLAELASPLLRDGGALVAWKGRRDADEEAELERAAAELAMRPVSIRPARPFPGSENRHLHLVVKSGPTPPGLPRRPGMAKKRPRGQRERLRGYGDEMPAASAPRPLRAHASVFSFAVGVVTPPAARPRARPRPVESPRSASPRLIDMGFVYAIANQKGGVGKTTTAVNLAACLAERGEQTLVVDLDPQCNATTTLGLDRESRPSSYDALCGEGSIAEAARPAGPDNLWVVPASRDLAGASVELPALERSQYRLRDGLGAVRERFSATILDCPPSLGPITVNALAAADRALVPVQAEYLALEGFVQFLDTVQSVRRDLNPSLVLTGIVITMADERTRLSQDVERELREHFPDLVLNTVVPRSVRVAEAPSFALPVTEHAPGSRGALAYTALAEEVLGRG